MDQSKVLLIWSDCHWANRANEDASQENDWNWSRN